MKKKVGRKARDVTRKQDKDKTSTTAARKNVENRTPLNSHSLPPKKNDSTIAKVRRSSRLNNSALPAQGKGLESTVEHIDLVENEREEESPCSPPQENVEGRQQGQQVSTTTNMNETNMATNMNETNLVETVTPSPNEDLSPSPELNYRSLYVYRSLYIDSQKKVEALMKEKDELVKKLEFARGQVAAYEGMKDIYCGSKEVIVIPGLDKAYGPLSLHPAMIQNPTSPIAVAVAVADPARKKYYRKGKAKP